MQKGKISKHTLPNGVMWWWFLPYVESVNHLIQNPRTVRDLFFKARNHQTANYLHSLKPVPEKSELWNTPFPCWVNRPIFRVYVGLVSGRVPIYTGFCPNSKNNTHTKRLQLFQNDFVFVDNFKRMALILLMEEILHHLGCIKPCK